MTDFFADLEQELRRAHAREDRGVHPVLRWAAPRRAALLRLAPLVTVAAAVVALAALVLAGAGSTPERDVAAPAAADPCAAPAPPSEIGQAFAVLRRPAGPRDELPQDLREDFPQSLDGLGRVWLDDARFARDDGERSYYVVPALLGGTCDPAAAGHPRPAVCVLAAAPYFDVPGCATLRRVEDEGLLLFSVPLDGARWRTSVLVADEAQPALLVAGRRVEGDVEGNVFVAEYSATTAEQEGSSLDVGGQDLHLPDRRGDP